MRRFLRSCVSASISVIVVMALSVTTMFGVFPTVAYAADETTTAPATGDATGEIVEARTEVSKDFREADGSVRTEVYSGPVNYQDDSGAWQAIDTTLRTDGEPGSYVSDRARTEVTFIAEDDEAPVGVARDGVDVQIDLLGAEEQAPLALGDSARYMGVASGADLLYQCLPSGLKQTLVLASAASPSAYTFKMTVGSGLLRQDSEGNYQLVASLADSEPVFTVGTVAVWDAAGVQAGPDDAAMSVVPCAGGAYLTYRVDPAWLSAPERVFPVFVDPSLVVETDTYVSEITGAGYPSSTILKAGRPDGLSTSDHRSLLRFAVRDSSIGIDLTDSYVYDAKFQVYASKVDATCPQARLATCGYFSPGVTWATKPEYTDYASQNIALGWSYWDVTGLARQWADSDYAGSMSYLQLCQREDGTQAARFYKEYYSNDAANYKPKIMIDHTTPVTTWASVEPTYVADGSDAITATVDVTVGYRTHVRRFDVQAKGTEAGQSVTRGQISWFQNDPGAGWVSLKRGDGYFAYQPADHTYTMPLLDRCSSSLTDTGRTFSFVYAPLEDWGGVQGVSHQWRITMDPEEEYTTPALQTGWKAGSASTFDVLPAVVQPLADVSGATWFTETDTDGDGVADNRADSGTDGRGAAVLNWGASATATGYRILLSDGVTYRQVGTAAGSATSWTSAGKGLYPTDSAIAAMAASSTVDPYLSGTGLELRDDPNALYRKTAATDDVRTHYEFRVVPYNVIGDGPATDIAVQLPNRTLGVNDDPRHASYDLGQMADHGASAVLDTGELELDVTDLDVASFGPAASLDRVYSSENTATSLFAPGWRFGFEQSVEGTTGASRLTLTDESGETHAFIRTGSTYRSPKGFFGSMEATSGGFALAEKGHMRTEFASDGRLRSVADGNGNTTRYAWASPGLVITAANGQSIEVAIADGAVTGAEYATADGARLVSYESSPVASVSYSFDPAASGAGYTVAYGYEDDLLTSLAVPGFSPGGVDAAWGFAYASGALSEVRYPGWAPSGSGQYKHSAIAYSTSSATVTRFGDVEEQVNVAVDETYTWNPSGTLASRTNPRIAGGATETWTYGYSSGNLQDYERSPLGAVTRQVVDGRGDTTIEYDALGNRTTSLYNSAGDLVRTTDPRGAVTDYAVDAAGNVTREQRDLGSGLRSDTTYEYSAAGLLTRELTSLSSTQTAETLYSQFADNGEPKSTTQTGVQLAVNDSAQTIVTSCSYDAFGNRVSSTDALGTATTVDTYDPAGRVVESEDASGVVTRHRYDVVGNEVESWRSAEGTSTRAEWRTSVFDAEGRPLSETSWLHEPSLVPSATAQTTVVHTYDALGREVSSDDAVVAGQPSKTVYDARGNALTTWSEGAPDYSDIRSTRVVYDADGRQTSQTEPDSEASATVTVYLADGSTSQETAPDGTVTKYVHDAAGNVVTQFTSGADGSMSGTWSVYDLGGRVVRETDADGADTLHTYDLAGRELTVKGEGPASGATFNVLGWTLAKSDADGIVSETDYDRAGRSLTERVKGTDATVKTTTTSYDGMGRTIRSTDPDGRVIAYLYDALGRTAQESHTTTAGVIKQEAYTYDSLGRMQTTRDLRTGIDRTFTYPTGSPGPTLARVQYGSVTTTVTVAADGLETSRASTIGTASVTRSTTTTDNAGRETSWTVGSGSYSRTFDDAGRITNWSAPGTIAGLLTYDAAGRKSRNTLTGGLGAAIDSSYTYSDAGRLLTVKPSGIATSVLTFDDAGNLTTETVGTAATAMTYDPVSQRLLNRAVVGSIVATYTFNGLGQRTYQGPTTNRFQTAFAYTGTGRLASYATSAGVSASYTYDAAGQRIGSVVTSSGVTTTSKYTYEGLSLLSLEATAASTPYTVNYLYDASGRAYAGTYKTAAGTTVFRLVTTDRGDVVELLDVNGARFASYRYDEWGLPTATVIAGTTPVPTALATEISTRQVLRYAGYCYDQHSGMYYLSARTYDPTTRQFLSKDPAKADGEESAYQYCGGDPVGNVDPSGLRVDGGGGTGSYVAPTAVYTWSRAWRTVRWWKWYAYGSPMNITAKYNGGSFSFSASLAGVSVSVKSGGAEYESETRVVGRVSRAQGIRYARKQFKWKQYRNHVLSYSGKVWTWSGSRRESQRMYAFKVERWDYFTRATLPTLYYASWDPRAWRGALRKGCVPNTYTTRKDVRSLYK